MEQLSLTELDISSLYNATNWIYFDMNNKPLLSIEKIGLRVKESPDSFSMNLKKNQRVDFQSQHENGYLYFLESGSVSIYRVSDDVLTINMKSPSIIGLTQLRNYSKYHYLRCDGECMVWAIKKSDFERILDEREYWGYAFDILSYIAIIYYERDIMISRSNAKMIVIDHLRQLWKLTQVEGEVHSIYKFILSRNNISRSAVHKVISELSHAGSIEVHRGKLVNLSMDEMPLTP